MNLAITAAAPLTPEQIVLMAALLLLSMIVLSVLDTAAEIEDVADELDALPRLDRRSVRRTLDARRWRWR